MRSSYAANGLLNLANRLGHRMELNAAIEGLAVHKRAEITVFAITRHAL